MEFENSKDLTTAGKALMATKTAITNRAENTIFKDLSVFAESAKSFGFGN